MTPIDPAIEQEMDKAHLADYYNRLIKNDIGFLIAQSLSWSEYRFKLAIECLLEEAHAKAIETIEDHYLTEDENIMEGYFGSGKTTLERMGKNLLFHIRQDVFIKLIIVLIYANIKYLKNDYFKGALLGLTTRNRYISRVRAIILSRYIPFQAFKGLNKLINDRCNTKPKTSESLSKTNIAQVTRCYELLFSKKSNKILQIIQITQHAQGDIIKALKIDSNLLLKPIIIKGMNAIFFSALVDAYRYDHTIKYDELIKTFGTEKQVATYDKASSTIISQLKKIIAETELCKSLSIIGEWNEGWYLSVHDAVFID